MLEEGETIVPLCVQRFILVQYTQDESEEDYFAGLIFMFVVAPGSIKIKVWFKLM